MARQVGVAAQPFARTFWRTVRILVTLIFPERLSSDVAYREFTDSAAQKGRSKAARNALPKVPKFRGAKRG